MQDLFFSKNFILSIKRSFLFLKPMCDAKVSVRYLLQIFWGCTPSSVSCTVPWASSRWDMPGTPPEGGVQGHSKQMTSPDSSRCGGAAVLYGRVTHPISKECPAVLQRKLISAACIRDLVLSVMTHCL
ncbi:hypothetical protein CHARACLAT_016248 [Characodon lateralis]|uniref:Uncharacterized protein n=1 Tax=Characodon lateralis TaxID=208331 RepID=A0ABU7DJA4_9TELE|nr:hypothetical protein [Characodon lateralis]